MSSFRRSSTGFVDTTWIGRGGFFHSDKMHIVEKLKREGDVILYDLTLEDPEVLTAPWVVPKQTLVLAPFDRIMPLNCSGLETQGLMDGAAKQSPGK